MPTYEYRCPKGHVFDVFQKMSDPPKAKCPKCGEAGTRQMVPGMGFLLKGEGFYITDNRPESYKREASSDAVPGSTYEPKASGTKGGESGTKEGGKAGGDGGEKEGGSKESGATEGGSPKKEGGSKGSSKRSGRGKGGE